VDVQATVYVGETNTLAQLFEVSGAAKSNPVTTDAKGFYSFSLADGDYRIVFSSSQFATLRISVLDGAQIREEFDDLVASNTAFRNEQQAAYDAFVLSQGWTPVGTFAAGFTFTSPNQVGKDADGIWWRWNGALPKTVTAGTLPESDDNYKVVGDGVLRSDLAAGLADVKLNSGEIFGTSGAGSITITPSGRVGIGENDPASMLAVKVENNATAGIRCKSEWTGSTALPYQNNDNCLFETYNKVTSDSLNLSWSVSAPNGYNDIPAGVIDSGARVGVYGWAVSVNVPGYTHAGTLGTRYGLYGKAGFQGGGSEASPAWATILKSVGVLGEIRSDSAGTSIPLAMAGEFLSRGHSSGTVENNFAIYALAETGFGSNYSFFGEAGNFYNRDKAFFGTVDTLPFSESNAKISSRINGNSFEFGFPSAGFGSNIGSTPGGKAFIAFNAEAGTSVNTYTTKGVPGTVIEAQQDGSVIVGVLPDDSASGQSLVPAFTITAGAAVSFNNILRLASVPDHADDTAAASGGVPVTGVYRTGSVLKIRVS